MRETFGQLVRYGLVGIASALTHFLAAIAIVEIVNISPKMGNAIGFCVGFITSFLGHHHWTYSAAQPRMNTLPRFTFVAVVSFAINGLLFAILVDRWSVPYPLAVAVALTIIPVANFTSLKFWTFADR